MKANIVRARALCASQAADRLGLSQTEIAAALGASQSQVSRILSGRTMRRSRLMEEVCLYVERADVGVTAEAIAQNEELIEALRATWDGSATHARALSTVIRSLSVLRTSPCKSP